MATRTATGAPRERTTADAVEAVEERLHALVGERQRLRADGAPAAELERNRGNIIAAQRQLAEALIARHGGRVGEASPAQGRSQRSG